MVQFCSALNMMLVCVSAIMALELMALLLGLRAPGAPKMTLYPLNLQMFDCDFNLSELSCLLDVAFLEKSC